MPSYELEAARLSEITCFHKIVTEQDTIRSNLEAVIQRLMAVRERILGPSPEQQAGSVEPVPGPQEINRGLVGICENANTAMSSLVARLGRLCDSFEATF